MQQQTIRTTIRQRLLTWRFLEFTILFGLPPAIMMIMQSRMLMILLLWGGALGLYLLLRRDGWRHQADWNWSGALRGFRQVMLRFALLAPLITLFAWWHMPDRFLGFPAQAPERWAMVMLLYPILSVWPQELIYRSFILHRYGRDIFTGKAAYIAVSALAFGYLHIIFDSYISFLMTAAGGAIFAATYIRHRSLALVCIEHSLYGCLIFTIGLGMYFYTGSAWN